MAVVVVEGISVGCDHVHGCGSNHMSGKKDLGMARGAYMGLYVAIPLVIYAGVLSGTLYVLKKTN